MVQRQEQHREGSVEAVDLRMVELGVGGHPQEHQGHGVVVGCRQGWGRGQLVELQGEGALWVGAGVLHPSQPSWGGEGEGHLQSREGEVVVVHHPRRLEGVAVAHRRCPCVAVVVRPSCVVVVVVLRPCVVVVVVLPCVVVVVVPRCMVVVVVPLYMVVVVVLPYAVVARGVVRLEYP